MFSAINNRKAEGSSSILEVAYLVNPCVRFKISFYVRLPVCLGGSLLYWNDLSFDKYVQSVNSFSISSSAKDNSEASEMWSSNYKLISSSSKVDSNIS